MLPDLRARALSFASYLEKTDMNVPTMRENFEDTEIREEDREYFSRLLGRLHEGSVTILAISESWCGDCVENLPVFAKVEAEFPFIDLIIVPRDQNLDIMDRFDRRQADHSRVRLLRRVWPGVRISQGRPRAPTSSGRSQAQPGGLEPEEQKKACTRPGPTSELIRKARDETTGPYARSWRAGMDPKTLGPGVSQSPEMLAREADTVLGRERLSPLADFQFLGQGRQRWVGSLWRFSPGPRLPGHRRHGIRPKVSAAAQALCFRVLT